MVNNQPLFSVLIANYNNGTYLEDCLKSVFKQTYNHWEIIIVDDNSTDGISQIIYTTHANNPKIKIFNNEANCGCGYTKNRCAEYAKGEIMAYLDPDDTITPDALELSVKAHRQNKNASLIYSDLAVCDKNLNVQYIKKPESRENVSTAIFDSYAQCVNHFASFKKSCYNLTDGISKDLMRAVDKDLYYKLEEVGDLKYINHCLYNYRIHDFGISTKHNRLKAEYWSWVVLIRTAERRGINLEGYYESQILEKISKRDTQLKKSKDYRLGSLLLYPFRKIFSLLKLKSI